MNTRCKDCPKAQNGLNGRYCLDFEIYVEHAENPPCENTTE